MIKFVSHLEKVVAHIEATNKRNLRDATLLLYGAVQRRLTGARRGREYRIPGTDSTYTASAPGESPAKRTGALASSIRYDVSATLGRVGTDNEYAKPLETGTARIEPRPFVEPAAANSAAEIERIMSRGS